MNKKIPLIYFLFSMFLFSAAQYNENDFEQYTVLNGLSDNNVHSLYQDSLGYLWIATQMGLNNFDGKEFKHHYPGTKPLNIRGTYIVNILSFSNNRIGIVTRRGLQLINAKDYSAENFSFPDTSYFTTYQNALLDAVELPDKSTLLCSRAGIYSFDKSDHINFRYDEFPGKPEKKPQAYVQFVTMINNDELLIYTTGNKLDHYDFRNRQLTHIKSSSKKWAAFFPHKIFGSTCARIDNNQFILFNRYTDSLTFYDNAKSKKVTTKFLWLGKEEFNWESKVFKIAENQYAITCARNGYFLFHLDKQTGIFTSDAKKYLASYKCNCLFVDSEKRLWAGTRTGLLKQRKSLPFISSWLYQDGFEKTYNLKLSSIYRYKDKLYIGAANRFEGLFVIDTATMKVIRKITFYGGNNEWSDIESIQCYHKDTLWIGTLRGLLWLDINSWKYGCVLDNKGDTVLPGSMPLLQPPDNTGRAWFFDFMAGKVGYYDTAARAFTFFTMNSNPKLPFEAVKHIVYDADDNVWIAGHGLARWNKTTNQFDVMIDTYAGPNKFSDDIIAITADKRGSLWLFNAENVLLEYKVKEKKFYAHDASEGIPAFVQSIANYADDDLWFTTGSLLLNYNIITKKINYFNQSDGLPVERASSRTIFFDKERNCFYSLHNNYVAVFSASLDEKINPNKKLLITKITVTDTTFYNPSGYLALKYRQNNLSLYFTVLDYDAPDAYNFNYRVNEKEWINLDGNQVIFFYSLPAGNYQVDIMARGKSGEQYISTISLAILSPFWQTWWFYLLCLTIFTAILYALYKFRLEQIKKVYSLRTKISRDLHDDIGTTLGSISIYSEVAKNRAEKNENSSEVISKIGTASRELIEKMSDIVWSLNPNNENFEQLQNRMQAFAAMTLTSRNIQFDFIAADEIKKIKLTAEERKNIFLIFKETIHNIVKYAECKKVEINLSMQNNQFEMQVKDDGKGFDASPHPSPQVEREQGLGGNGIKNMKARAESMHAGFSISSEMNKGTTIKLSLNL